MTCPRSNPTFSVPTWKCRTTFGSCVHCILFCKFVISEGHQSSSASSIRTRLKFWLWKFQLTIVCVSKRERGYLQPLSTHSRCFLVLFIYYIHMVNHNGIPIRVNDVPAHADTYVWSRKYFYERKKWPTWSPFKSGK